MMNIQRMRESKSHIIFPVNRNVTFEIVRFGKQKQEFEGMWVWPKQGVRMNAATKKVERCVLYLHGGGYCFNTVKTYRWVLAELAHRTKLPVFAYEYPLS